jgi:hypothetical protein
MFAEQDVVRKRSAVHFQRLSTATEVMTVLVPVIHAVRPQ